MCDKAPQLSQLRVPPIPWCPRLLPGRAHRSYATDACSIHMFPCTEHLYVNVRRKKTTTLEISLCRCCLLARSFRLTRPSYVFLPQFRLTNGVAITGTFEPTDTLSKVVSYVSSKRTDGAAPFSLSMTFPRKTFSESDMDKSLKDCGLVPSAVLVLTKQ